MSGTIKKRRIVFVHPDLGIGGAERLVVDAAVGLQSLGHTVTILTSYRDVNHCFDEARDGTLDVRVRGDKFFPASLRGRFSILFSILRQLALAFSISIFSNELAELDPDIFVVDQLSACIPFFRLLCPKAKILFYGHYPDRLLVQEGRGTLKHVKKLYRMPFDAFEGWSTACSDSIVVNSKYTRSVFRQTFPSMRTRELKVVYPCVNTETTSPPASQISLFRDRKVMLSINRFEGKKNLDLAIHAFAGLSAEERSRATLVVAGGYDPRNLENARVHKKLQELANTLGLTKETLHGREMTSADAFTPDVEVAFLLSVPQALKQRLLDEASLLVYTPTNEHFGIVPLEAMLAGIPVLATNTGGPLETVYDGRTGWLRGPDKVAQWTDVMRKPLIPSSAETLRVMGQRGRERVLREFSQTSLSQSLDDEVQRLCQSTAPRPVVLSGRVWMFLISIGAITAAITAIVVAILLRNHA